jgi:hypothetical protein
VVDLRSYGDGVDLVPLSIVKFIGSRYALVWDLARAPYTRSRKDSTGDVRLLPFIDVGTFLVAAYMRSSQSPKAPR